MIKEIKKPIKEIQRMREQEDPTAVMLPSNHVRLFYSTLRIFQDRITNYLLKISIRYPLTVSDKKYLKK
jgi:hypothetical protein